VKTASYTVSLTSVLVGSYRKPLKIQGLPYPPPPLPENTTYTSNPNIRLLFTPTEDFCLGQSATEQGVMPIKRRWCLRTTWSASVTREKSDAEYASLNEARQECVQNVSGE